MAKAAPSRLFCQPLLFMEAKRQQPESGAFKPKSGSVQSVVQLIALKSCGLVFWSRQQFDLTAELQLKLEKSALRGVTTLANVREHDGWVVVRGYVVDCAPARRPDGTVGFEVTLVFGPEVGFNWQAGRVPKDRQGFALN